MKYFLSILFSLFLISSSSVKIPKNAEETSFRQMDDRELCEIVCSGKNLPCLEVLDKTVYDGKTEKAKVLSKQVFSICLEYPEESNPT